MCPWRVAISGRWLVNFTATDNLSRSPDDHTEFGVNVASDVRLPDGGGYVLGGLYNVTPTGAPRLQQQRPHAGEQRVWRLVAGCRTRGTSTSRRGRGTD